ncbi:sensor domain-containing diguanylate cyclase [Paracidovorax anthurii]|uniref:PAS domain S-box-containing protein/diguanylate cyclase (GGDEF)-like protein n=1 Tax=Paracidovorax anthurii TaxID=78229 RepID=A0A328Z962_9BURK|nr:sensor domain-containing diguanylate cyclase [Paracidovorax anthurii]RAR82578.1 PAS domain S-box-containing protein/diguanylate cyclase (GGDEF)-like protein [Paracidovorax anthurii]
MKSTPPPPPPGRIWPFVAIVVLQVLLASGSIYLLSAVRAFVAGESQWSKAQKDAIWQLDRYIVSGDRHGYDRFKEAMQTPQADEEARVLLESADPDMDRVFNAVVRGGNHPADAGALMWIWRTFQHHALLSEPLRHWKIGDSYLRQLSQLAEEVRERHESGIPPDAPTVLRWQRALQDIDAGASPAASDFSEAMGESSRRIVASLFWLNGVGAILLMALAVLYTRRMNLQRRHAASTLAQERTQAEATLAAIEEPILQVDAQGKVEAVNTAAERLLGQDGAALRGRALSDLLVFEEAKDAPHEPTRIADQWLARALQGVPSVALDRIHPLRLPGGQRLPVRLRGGPLIHEGGPAGAVLMLHEAGGEQRCHEQLAWHSTHDGLTGLADRQTFIRQIAATLEQPRSAESAGALLQLHLDLLGAINDAHGYAAGDALLRAMARGLEACLGGQGTLARLGGATFGALIPHCSRQAAQDAAERLLGHARALELPWPPGPLATPLSIGLVALTADLATLEEALRAAHQACGEARQQGGDRLCAHAPPG